MKRVLVIEDNRDNLKLISYVLQRHGYAVDTAENGEEGVLLADELEVSFILMDIDLPGIDGLETTRQIRAAQGDAVPIIAITSLAMAGDRERILAAGCNGYFEKPINPLTIMDDIHRVLEAQGWG
jgi:CheY-like chemotaxis protein